MRARFLLTLILVTSMLVGTTGSVPASAANRVVMKDAAGDQAFGGPEFDLLQADLYVENRPGRGRWLVITWQMAAPPPPTAGGYGLEARILGCGTLLVSVHPNTAFDLVGRALLDTDYSPRSSVTCIHDSDGTANPEPEVEYKGSTILARVPTDWLPIPARSGVISSSRAFTELSEPLLGSVGTDAVERPADEAGTAQRLEY